MGDRRSASREQMRRGQRASVEIEVIHEGWSALADIERLNALAMAAAGERSGEISIKLSGDSEIRALNRDYRSLDKPTNVLSFPAAALVGHVPALIGDIILAYETTAREASSLGIPLADHAAHLVVHGVLHLIGYDHQTEAEAEAMEVEERRILAAFGIADPYLRLDVLEEAPANG